MFTWPSSTAPVRPASDSVRSVPSATILTSSAASKTSAIRRIFAASASQSSSTAPHRNSVYSSSVIPASCAVAGTGYSATTHGAAIDMVRSRSGRRRASSATLCSSDRSDPSTVDSGAQIVMNASASSQIRRCSGAASRRYSRGATRSNGPPIVSNTIVRTGCAGTRASSSSTASTSGLASAVVRIDTCHPSWTAMHRRTISRAYSSTRGSRIDGLDQPRPVALDDLAVQPELAPRAQVLDDVPVHGALVDSARDRVRTTEGEVDGAGDLLVEQRVLHVPRDPRVAADAELAEHAGAGVGVEDREQELLVRGGAGVDDAAALEPEPRAADLVAVVHGRELGERYEPFGRVLERREEDLAAGKVDVAVVDRALAPLDAEQQVGPGPDEPHLGRGIEAVGDPAHPLGLGIPVQEARREEKVLERGRRHRRILRERRRRELAGDPRAVHGGDPCAQRRRGTRDQRAALRRDVGCVARVL